MTEEEVKALIQNPCYSVFHAKLQDKFGDHGIIAFALIDKNKDAWHIQSLLMSCRVFGRNVEGAFIETIFKQASRQGVKEITIAFEETPKNTPAREFILKYSDKKDGANILKMPCAPGWIKIKYENI